MADRAWKELALINPEKGEVEPWSEGEPQNHNDELIWKMMRSSRMEERLYSLFLISISDRKEELLMDERCKSLDECTLTEKLYIKHILLSDEQEHSQHVVGKSHEVALKLYERFRADERQARDVLLTWFSIYISIIKSDEDLINILAIAAATEYIWLRGNNKRKTQTELANDYGLSISTIRKYIQLLQNHS
ncbi:hypothetical protein ACI2OX_05705 [Bacillus sp. N9]